MAAPLSYDAFRARSRLPALDGLRALACLAVVIGHTRGAPYAILHGYRGVLLFFVLSGFLITTLALREEAARGWLDLRAFFIRRFFRIAPLYYLALAAILVWVFAFHMEGFADRLRHYFWTYPLYVPEFQIFQFDFKIPFSHGWSLGIEEKFYLLWPVVGFWLMARSRHRIPLTIGLIAATGWLNAHTHTYAQMWGGYSDILIGCLAALLLHERRIYEKLACLGRTSVAWVLFLAAAVAMTSTLTGTQFGERYFSMFAAVAMMALAMSDGGPVRLLSHPWLAALGAWSYGIYLFHLMIYDLVNTLIPAGAAWNYLTMPANLLIAVPLARFLHRHYEQPMLAFGRSLAAAPSLPAAVWRHRPTSAAHG